MTLGCRAGGWLGRTPDPTPTPIPAAGLPAATATAAPTTAPPAPVVQTPAALAPTLAVTEFVEAVAQDASTFNPLFAANPTELAVAGKLFPRLLGQDPANGQVVANELAEAWEWSPDGRTLTITLRSGVAWSDGMPVTASDAAFTFNALAQSGAASPRRALAEPIESASARDDRIFVVRLRAPHCAALQNFTLPLLPAHRFAADFSDLASNPFNAAPDVSAGPFLLPGRLPGASITLERNPAYWKGAPAIERYTLRVVADEGERLRLVTAGQADLAAGLDPGIADAAGDTGNTDRVLVPSDAYTMLALNNADPGAPQAGRTPAGEVVAQPPHPILGDVRVRRALAAALDLPAIVRALDPASAIQSGYILPSLPWADAADLPPTAYDPAQAGQLLAEAGWVDGNGDGLRERAGASLQLTLLTNDDNPRRVQAAQAVAAQLRAAGFGVTVAAVPFADLSARVLGQTYDFALVGWDDLGADPGAQRFWHTRDDLPGAGFNVTSYASAEVDRLLDAAAATPGCPYDLRGAAYREAERLVQQDVPAIPLALRQTVTAVGPRWAGVAPGPWGYDANVYLWSPAAP